MRVTVDTEVFRCAVLIVDPIGWRWGQEALRGVSSGNAFAVWQDVPVCSEMTIEATVTPKTIVGRSWKLCGLAIYFDRQNFWQ